MKFEDSQLPCKHFAISHSKLKTYDTRKICRIEAVGTYESANIKWMWGFSMAKRPGCSMSSKIVSWCFFGGFCFRSFFIADAVQMSYTSERVNAMYK